MKTIKKLITAIALAGISTGALHAAYSVTLTSDHETQGAAEQITLGQTATFNMTATAVGGNQIFDLVASTITIKKWNGSSFVSYTPINTPVISLADGTQITGSPTAFTVNWTPAVSGLYQMRTSFNTDFGGGTVFTYNNVSPAAVPEPAQTVAAGVIACGGGLLFFARRKTKNQTA